MKSSTFKFLKILSVAAGALIIGPTSIYASNTKPITTTTVTVSDSDIAPIVDYLDQYTYATTQPNYVYKWISISNGTTATDASDSTSSSDPRGMAILKQAFQSGGYIQSNNGYNNNFSSNTGVVLDSDPVVGRNNLHGSDWQLLQVKIEAGTRIANLGRDGANSLPGSVTQALDKLGCPKTITRLASIFEQHEHADSATTPKCFSAIYTLFQRMKLSGFTNSAMATHFDACDDPSLKKDPTQNSGFGMGFGNGSSMPAHQAGVQLTDLSGIDPSDVKLFTKNTQDSLEDRTRIESMFYKADTDNKSAYGGYGSPYGGGYGSGFGAVQALTPAQLQALLTAHPGYNFSSNTVNCTTNNVGINSCTPIAWLCPNAATMNGNPNSNVALPCIQVDIPVDPPAPAGDPTKMSNATPPKSGGDSSLLWADLDGKLRDPNVSDWITKNFFGCQNGKASLVELQDYHPKGILTNCPPKADPAQEKIMDLHEKVKKIINH